MQIESSLYIFYEHEQ